MWSVKISEGSQINLESAERGLQMSTESRVAYLLKAAARAEREGNARLADILRKMAQELSPADLGLNLPDPSGLPS